MSHVSQVNTQIKKQQGLFDLQIGVTIQNRPRG